jgi:hypothetical protein
MFIITAAKKKEVAYPVHKNSNGFGGVSSETNTGGPSVRYSVATAA